MRLLRHAPLALPGSDLNSRKFKKHAGTIFGLGIMLCAGNAHAELLQCQTEFTAGSAEVDTQELQRCLEMVGNKNIDSVFIVGAASPEGSTDQNQRLSEQRAEAIKQEIQRVRSDVDIATLATGASDKLGRSASVYLSLSQPEDENAVATASDDESDENEIAEMAPRTNPDSTPMAVTADAGNQAGETSTQPLSQDADEVALRTDPSAAATQMTATEVDDNALRAALRVGADNYRPEDHAYTAAGAEVAWFRNRSLFDEFRTEAGASVNAFTSEVHPNVFALHAFAGPGYQLDRFVPGVVVAGRAMVGGVWDANRKWHLDSGLEGRVGFETTGFSVFGGLGRTRDFTRLGVDVGVFF